MSLNLEVKSVEQSCLDVIKCLSESSLNFSTNITPYYMYITVRKSFAKNKVPPAHYQQKEKINRRQDALEKQVASLEQMLAKAEEENVTLQQNHEESIENCKSVYNEVKALKARIAAQEKDINLKEVNIKNETVIRELKGNNSDLEERVKRSENEAKELRKVVSDKSKQLHNVKKELETESNNLKELKHKFDDFTASVKRERKQYERKQKKKENSDFLNNLKKGSDNLYFQCDECDLKTETRTQLKFHMRSIHTNNTECQTDDVELKEKVVQTDFKDFTNDKNEQIDEADNSESFIKYPCNYCATNIANNHHQAQHIGRCRGTVNMSTEPGLPMLPFFSHRLSNHPPNFSRTFRF